MKAKYTHVRLDLETAKSWLDSRSEIDQHLSAVLDHIIETVMRIEHLGEPKHGNVLPFRLRKGRFENLTKR